MACGRCFCGEFWTVLDESLRPFRHLYVLRRMGFVVTLDRILRDSDGNVDAGQAAQQSRLAASMWRLLLCEASAHIRGGCRFTDGYPWRFSLALIRDDGGMRDAYWEDMLLDWDAFEQAKRCTTPTLKRYCQRMYFNWVENADLL